MQLKEMDDLKCRIGNIKEQLPLQQLTDVIQFNKKRFVQNYQNRCSIKYSMFNSGFSTKDYQIYHQESSDSESLVQGESMYPSLHMVAETIFSSTQYTTVPCATVLKSQPPKSLLLLQNLSPCFNLNKFKEIIESMPIKGFIEDYKVAYYQSKLSLLVHLKTDQPLIVVNQLHSKKFNKSVQESLGNDFYSTQLVKMNEKFNGIIIRGLENSLSAYQIDKIISYTLNLKIKECIIESTKDIIMINDIGCMVIVLKDLELCERIVIQLNNGNLNGLQSNKILVNIHPGSSKTRLINKNESIQRGLFKQVKQNDEVVVQK